MKLDSVKFSSHVTATGYDSDALTMEIEYLDGSHYCWSNIPPNIYETLRAADSVGKYLRQIEKNFGKGIRIV